MDSNNVVDIHHQIMENSEDLQKYLLDLESWEKEMKKKEEELKLIQTVPDEEIPPVRNTLYRSKKKSRHKKQKDKNAINKTVISTTDYQAWEKFDANAELKKIDEEAKHSSASDNSENEDEFYKQKRKQLALLQKDKGNDFFKKGNYDSAINSYTAGMQLDPENPLLAANRAMAFLKKEQYQSAENDCTLCLSIDPTYVKAYLRRGTARKMLNKISLARADFSKALELEPENKQAQTEMKKLSEHTVEEDISNIPENEVVKTQELWSQFLGNKTSQNIKEPSEKASSDYSSCVENACIFPDSCSIAPGKPSTSNETSNAEIEVEIMETDESSFVKIVEEAMNDLKFSQPTETNQVVTERNEPVLPSIPNSLFQFLADWNDIESDPTLRYKYLKQFPPEMLPVFFKHDMEPTIFPKLIETLSTSFIERGDDVFDYLKNLTEVGRFSTMLMFLSDKEEKDLKTLLEYTKTSKRPESDIADILKKYGA